ncbi:SDR family oxidoreductase [Umezawaea endophytica]|uniref:SDR family oxidoreductase n=1 Tax=Umezawaea endophytica TaxID=1654476 RepID=A0A9X2VW58_9PSEU|nr:SDR family oxidoreductase [Umezawaea endophytica]MCS7483785.1 SDR family oxidoreductase [Umezawaea endophytica]
MAGRSAPPPTWPRPTPEPPFWADYAAAGPLRDAPVRMLVNNVGISLRGTIEEFSAEDFARQQQVNDTAPFLITQAGLPASPTAGASSTSPERPWPHWRTLAR